MLGLEREFGLGKERRSQSQPPAAPPPGAKDPMRTVTVKLAESLWAWARILAIKEDRKASDVVRDALERMRAEIESAGD